MLVTKVSVKNFRSFLDEETLLLDGKISIIIGPNGGGKTNLLDAIVILLRRYLFASMYAAHVPNQEQQERYEFRINDALNNMALERHNLAPNESQVLKIEVAVTKKDIENMYAMQNEVDKLIELASKKYYNLNLITAKNWDVSQLVEGKKITYTITNGTMENNLQASDSYFLEYLQLFEIDGRLREEFDLAPLSTPLIYLPINRTSQGFQSNIQLHDFNDFETKRHSDAANSRQHFSIINLAIGRLAQKYRFWLEQDKGIARVNLEKDKNIKELTNLLKELGYKWSLETVNPLKNQYDIRLEKQGFSFLVGAASSGERELLTYLFSIFLLNVRDAIIIVDEPELHLHPKWQKTLLDMFIRLKESTGNQFLLATHSPTFISPDSIQYVSRVFSQDQKSRIHRLNAKELPNTKHLFNIVNSQNNESLFFADKVILVEGLSDRIFFEAFFKEKGLFTKRSVVEIISVGGKGLFDAYEKLLNSSKIPYSIIADFDYIKQIGSGPVKNLLTLNAKKIKEDVIDNSKSMDGNALVKAIDNAIENKNWDDAHDVWEYIKSKRTQLKDNLNKDENEFLSDFIKSKYSFNVYILSIGELEAYLPTGHASKDIGKLIQLVSSENFLNNLPLGPKSELDAIADIILKDL